MRLWLFGGKQLDVSWYRGLPLRPSGEQEKDRRIGSVSGTTFGDFYGGLSQLCNHLVLYLYAAGPAFDSLGIRANARVGFLRAKTAPGGQTKPNGCIVFLVLVSCSGQKTCGAGVWWLCVSKRFIVRHMMYMSIVCQILCFLGAFFWLKEQLYSTESVLARWHATTGLQNSINAPPGLRSGHYKGHSISFTSLWTNLVELSCSLICGSICIHYVSPLIYQVVYVPLSEARTLNVCVSFHTTKLQFVLGCGLTPYRDSRIF